MTDRQRELFTAMCKAADDYVDGLVDGDALHSAVVDFTDSVQTTPKPERRPLRISDETIRQAAHFGWLYPNAIDLRDPDVYGEAPCGCGCGATADDVRKWRNA